MVEALVKVVADNPCRVRLYRNAASVQDDIYRRADEAPEDRGILIDLVLIPETLNFFLNPIPLVDFTKAIMVVEPPTNIQFVREPVAVAA